MATTQSVRPLSQSPVLEHVTVQPNAQRLRASCDACAVSKVKCTKETPVCSRCAKRGVKCKYLATKKVGRSSQSGPRPSGKIQDNHQKGADSVTKPSVPSTVSPTAPPPNASLPGTPLIFDAIATSDAFNAVATPHLAFSDNGFDEYLASFVTDTLSDGNHHDFFGKSNGHNADDILSSFTEDTVFSFTSEDIDSRVDQFMTDINPPQEPPITQINQTYALSDISDAPSTLVLLPQSSNSPCCCLTITLGLLKQLSPDSIASCMHSSRPGSEDEASGPTTIDSIIAQNTHVMDSVHCVLQCACSSDGYILTTISLVILKALAWYATVFNKSPKLTLPTKVGGYQIDGGRDSHRMVAQLVLSELHRPQGVVNRFSQRVKLYAKHTMSSNVASRKHTLGVHTEDNNYRYLNSSLSAGMLGGLETELRQQLCTIRQEIVETLQRG